MELPMDLSRVTPEKQNIEAKKQTYTSVDAVQLETGAISF